MSRFGTDEKPVDTTYYDLLQIPVNADEKLIKKQYRLMAMKYHPDKNKEEGAEETVGSVVRSGGEGGFLLFY